MPTFLELTKQKWFLALGLIFLAFMGYVLVRQWSQKTKVQDEINALKMQASRQAKSNQDLQSFIAYLKTDEYKQKTAREQLNLKKNGEFVVSFSNNANSRPVLQDSMPAPNESVANPRKWWNYFFHPSI